MTENTADQPAGASDASSTRGARRKPGLEGMLLPELKQVAAGLGVKATGLRKGALVEAIRAAQSGGQSGGQAGGQAGGQSNDRAGASSGARSGARAGGRSSEASAAAPAGTPEQGPAGTPAQAPVETRDDAAPARETRGEGRSRADERSEQQPDQKQADQKRDRQDDRQQDRQPDRQQERQADQKQDRQQDRQQEQDDDDQGGSRRNRRRRGRDRNNADDRQGNQSNQGNQDRQGNQGNQQGQGRQDDRQQGQGRQQDRQDRQDRQHRRGEPDLQILEDDVLAPCAGILDLLDNYAFVRTSGYLPGSDDVYVSMSMVRKHGLRRGDAVAGQVRQPREGERREKFNPLVRIDTVNGADPESARHRTDFGKLTPVNPSERLRLETAPGELVGRALDLVTPIGKGQRGLVLSPAKAGKTTVLQAMAAAVTSNNPECHVMVVLVDERPEEVTDYARSIKGEVISSTFDRPPSDHTLIAELALERAKRLVELGHDVVLLLDGLTRLARAYNLAAASGGRGSAGVLDAAAVHQPKKFFGAARNIENGGSLTVVATASVGGSSPTDAAILEELEGTENMELRLCRAAAGTEVFPVFDVLSSGTRREELLLSEGELQAVRQLRRSLDALERDAAARRLHELLQGSATNLELLRSAPRHG